MTNLSSNTIIREWNMEGGTHIFFRVIVEYKTNTTRVTAQMVFDLNPTIPEKNMTRLLPYSMTI